MKLYGTQIVALVLLITAMIHAAESNRAGDNKGKKKYASSIGIRQGSGISSILAEEGTGSAPTSCAAISLASEEAGITVYHFEGASGEAEQQAVVLFAAPQRVYYHSVVSGLPEEKTGDHTLPSAYELHQNYPNPFNPNATIQYDLPAESRVKLTIYNALGQRIAELVDGVEEAGYKFVQWNAANFASGIYFYRLTATNVADASNSFQHIRKMVLMK